MPTVLTCKGPHRVTVSVGLLRCNLEGSSWDLFPLSQWPETLPYAQRWSAFTNFLIITHHHIKRLSVTHY